MSDSDQFRAEPPRMRRSGKVALVLLGTAGVITAAAAIDAWLKSREHDEALVEAPRPAPTPITTAQTYANNDYIPGVGYYHAPYNGWYPHPYNYHDPNRGYFAGGFWQALPWVLALQRSQPSETAVTSALAARRAQEQAEQQMRQARSSSSGFRGGYSSNFRSTGSGGTSAAPRSTPSSSPSKPGSGSGIQRGGFGSSGSHGSSGGSS